MSATSMDLRIRIVECYENGEGSQRAIAERFAVSAGLVSKLYKQKKETGCLKPRTALNHGKRKVTEEIEQKLREKLETTPDATLEELRVHVKLDCSVNTISLALKRMGLTNKKNATT